MKIAFIVLAHKNVAQVKMLLEVLQAENRSVFLHIDRLAKKSIYKNAKTELDGIKHLSFLHRYPTHWGSFGLIKATLAGIRQAILDPQVDYAILLSGQDFPIKPLSELENFLETSEGMSFMEADPFPLPHWKDCGGYERIQRWYFSLPLKPSRLTRRIRVTLNQAMNQLKPHRKFPTGYSPYGGSQWWCLHRDCLHYISTFYKEERAFTRFFRTVRIPDELFFHTILMNSHLKRRIINRRLTYVDWGCSPGPKVLDRGDLEKLEHSDAFFARKFDLSTHPKVLQTLREKIEQHL